MFVRTLTQNVDLDAAEFFGDVEQKARDKFIRETEGKCMKDCGEVDAVLEILATEQKPLLSSGHARFQVTCRARVHRIGSGDRVVGKVANQDALGSLVECRAVSVYVHAHFQHSGELPQVGDEVQVEILAVRFESGKFQAVGRWV
jgi:DNA-directed RNA polymerase subunit E'/Rpb7